MMKYLLGGAAIVTMTAGLALAQGTNYYGTTVSQTTTNANPPVAEGYAVSKTQKTVEPDGTVVQKSSSYTTGVNGTEQTVSSQTTAPQPIAPPDAAETTTTQTTAPFVSPAATPDAAATTPGVAPPDNVNNETITTQSTQPVPVAPPPYQTTTTRTTTTTTGQ